MGKVIGWSIPLLGLIGLYIWMWGAQTLHFFAYTTRETTPFFFPFAVAIAVVIVVALLNKILVPVVVAAAGVAALVAGIAFSVPADYNRLNTYYNTSVETLKDSIPHDYEERTPYEVAVTTSEKSLMDVTGESSYTKSLSDEGEHGTWNTLIVARGIGVGYESVQVGSYPLYGTSSVDDVHFCGFNNEKQLRHGGWFPHNNLKRAIFWEVPANVGFDAYNAYGYCNEDEEPIVVTPLTQVDGFFYPTVSFYGVALYNGVTGELDIVTDNKEIDEIPGSVYPITLAAVQRESLKASGDYWDYAFSRSGYETATANSEVLLRSADGSGDNYVTALRPRGSSTSIVAIAEIAGTVAPKSGERNTMFLNLLPKSNYRPANSTLVDDIRSQYSYMPDISNSSVKVFEITIGLDGGWVASIGREQSVIYRAYITPGEPEIVLMNSKGEAVGSGTVKTEVNEETGETEVVEFNTDFNLSEMSEDELAELGKAIFEEISNR